MEDLKFVDCKRCGDDHRIIENFSWPEREYCWYCIQAMIIENVDPASWVMTLPDDTTRLHYLDACEFLKHAQAEGWTVASLNCGIHFCGRLERGSEAIAFRYHQDRTVSVCRWDRQIDWTGRQSEYETVDPLSETYYK